MTNETSSLRRRRPGRPAGGQPGEGQEALLQAARELMVEKGLPRLTVREVAERAGVKPALVNYYFGGKQGLLRATVFQSAAEANERLRDTLSSTERPAEQLRQLVHAWVRLMSETPSMARLTVEQVLFADSDVLDEFIDRCVRPNFEVISEVLSRGRETGELRAVDPGFFTPAFVGGCAFFFLAEPVVRKLLAVEEITPAIADAFAESVADVVLNGVVMRAGDTG